MDVKRGFELTSNVIKKSVTMKTISLSGMVKVIMGRFFNTDFGNGDTPNSDICNYLSIPCNILLNILFQPLFEYV
ncbi:MAG: hypothetical protein BWY45_00883 [Euryarchaeota archaeon ADurb.Bin294]|jgi:hypothetical protein|nr:MAG: hypothetical protein BWY45_00883 [Euryarchaeota archaeon ADurb.Bin294]